MTGMGMRHSIKVLPRFVLKTLKKNFLLELQQGK